ncbi:hypothetical protein ACFFRR_009893 [Megaselia abdita]
MESDSDYFVEEFIKPMIVRPPVNGDKADLLGNFDDAKREEILSGGIGTTVSEDEEVNEDSSDDDEIAEPTTKLTDDQLTALLKGSGRSNRFVLYCTNISDETSKQDLINLFSQAGEVKGIRRPEGRRGKHFAFVEMVSIEGFKNAFELHNTELNGKTLKIQISEGGKKKTANKKNILKQKNRKLAEMRNEPKAFNKSGKFFDKNIKKEIAKVMVNEKKKWRKFPNSKGGAGTK